MKALIIGGSGFIGHFLVQRLYKEGLKVYVIDKKSKNKDDNNKIKSKFYNVDLDEVEKVDHIFNGEKFDIVIYLVSPKDKNSLDRLKNILEYSSQTGVQKFIYLSSTKVYGDTGKNIKWKEDYEANPTSFYGIRAEAAEKYCRLWGEKNNLKMCILRTSAVYGPGMNLMDEENSMAIVIKNSIYELQNPGTNTTEIEDYIYVGDVVDGIYKAIEFSYSTIINLSSGKSYDVREVENYIKSMLKKEKVLLKDLSYSNISNNKAIEELNWVPMFSIEKGLELTIQWIKEYNEDLRISEGSTSNKRRIKENKVIPYIENFTVFILVIILDNIMNRYGIKPIIDIRLLYIIVMAVVYGIGQSSIATALSSIMYLLGLMTKGQSFLSIVYNPNVLINISTYIFVGSVLGYTLDSKKNEIVEKEIEIRSINDKFKFMYGLYNETKDVKNNLQKQIATTEDSIGKVYKVISKLDFLRGDRIFDEAISVIEEIMKEKQIAIYIVSKNNQYLRLVAHSSIESMDIPKSIELDNNKIFKDIVDSNGMFTNKYFEKYGPSMACPIAVDEKVIGVIAIYNMDFENMTLYKENLFSVIGRLITESLGRAYKYEEAIFDKRYVQGTYILNKDYFKKIIEDKKDIMKNRRGDFVVLKVNCEDYIEVYEGVISSIRDIDYLGIGEENKLFILLSNTDDKEGILVQNRLLRKNILTTSVKPEEVF